MARFRILVLGDDTRSFLATVRSLGRAGHEVFVAGSGDEAAPWVSRYIARRLELEPFRPGDAAWVKEFRAMLERNAIDFVLPCSDPATLPLMAVARAGPMRAGFYVQPEELFATLNSKIEMHRLADELGIPLARGTTVSTVEEAQSVLAELPPPWVFKPEASMVEADVGTRNAVAKAFDAKEAAALATEFAARGRFQIQQNFIGVGAGVEVLCDRGEILLAFNHLRVHEPMHGGGSSYRRGATAHPGMMEATRKLMRRLRYTGVAMVEFKWNRTSDAFVFMEVNPRFWGSLPLAVASGADFPRALVDLLLRHTRSFPYAIRTDLWSRNLTLDVAWMGANRYADKRDPTLAALPWSKVLGEVGTLLAGKERWDTLTLDDPMPFFREVAQIALEKAKALRLRFVTSSRYLAATLPIRRRRLRERLKNARTIGFVCYGNICRSPFAAEYSRARLPKFEIFSAGFHRVTDRPAPRNAVVAAEACGGVDLSAHRSRRMTAKLAEAADILLVFDTRNLREVHWNYPKARSKTFLLSDLGNGSVIDDPWGRDLTIFESTYKTIGSCIDAMATDIGVPLAKNR